MSILSQSGKIILVREPVCGRFGIHRLIAQLTSGALNVSGDGKSEITMVTFMLKITKVIRQYHSKLIRLLYQKKRIILK